MMKLKYLFDNRDLALMLLKNWEYNGAKLESLNDFRISSNAVYPIFIGETKCFLRFAPTDEKTLENVRAELEFLRYLHKMGYKAAETVSAKDGEEVVVRDTPWGEYIAVVFKGAQGMQMTELAYSDELYYEFGRSLARLHQFSKCFQPVKATRPDWNQQLDWCERLLTEYGAGEAVLTEVNILRNFFGKLPKTRDSFGLVHYDFESQNVFYDPKTKEFCPIDFDDSVYHWFIIDVDRSIRAIQNTLSEKYVEPAVRNFQSGYRSEMELSDDQLSLRPICKRYCDLYGYTRRLRTLSEKWENEPEWMVELRNKLTDELSEKVICFGRKLDQ